MLQWGMTEHNIKKVLVDEEILFNETNEGVDNDYEESLAFSLSNVKNALGILSTDMY